MHLNNMMYMHFPAQLISFPMYALLRCCTEPECVWPTRARAWEEKREYLHVVNYVYSACSRILVCFFLPSSARCGHAAYVFCILYKNHQRPWWFSVERAHTHIQGYPENKWHRHTKSDCSHHDICLCYRWGRKKIKNSDIYMHRVHL